MKKGQIIRRFVVLAVTFAMITGCEKEENGFVTFKSVKVEKQYQQVVKDAEALLKDYYLGMHAGSFEQCMAPYPDFYKEAEKKWIDAYYAEQASESSVVTDYDAFIKEDAAYFSERYGDDYKVKLSIDNLYDLTESSCADMEKVMKKHFDADIDLTACYGITVTESMSGSKMSEDTSISWYLLCFDDKMYLYDNAHESQESENSDE